MANYSTVPCFEKHNSRQETWSAEGSSASVTLVVDWAKRYDLVLDLFNQTPARPYPYNGQTPVDLFVNSARVVNLENEEGKQSSQSFEYSTAEVEVTYTVPTVGPLGGVGSRERDPTTNEEVFITETITSVSEFHTLNPDWFSWSDNPATLLPLKEDEGPVVQSRALRIERSIRGLSSVSSDVLDYPNTVNLRVYTSRFLGMTFGIGELLFLEPVITRSISRVAVGTVPVGSRFTFDLTLSFGYKKGGWNFYPNIGATFDGGRGVPAGGRAMAFIDFNKILYTRRVRSAADPTKLQNPQPRFISYPYVNFSRFLW